MSESSSVHRDGERRIGKQIRLPWRKAIEIAVKSVKVRFWRSMITMSSIVLAIAFLMSIWTSTAITASLAVAPQREIGDVKGRIRLVRQTIDGAEGALSPAELKKTLASDLETAILDAQEAIEEKEEEMEDAGTEQRNKLAEEIKRLKASLEPDNHVELLHEHLRTLRRELEEEKGRIDTTLQQERGGVGQRAESPEPASEAEGDADTPALRSSVMDFINEMSPTDTWLAVLALLVCLVGIANAMFMTVQERFREIGTMKCLGALDGFIVKIFLIESASLGFIGTVLGVIVGLILSSIRQWLVYGGSAIAYYPKLTVFLAGALAALIGLVLSIGAAIWPAQKAARMEPVEAMRVEE
jgi:hypothetical protein